MTGWMWMNDWLADWMDGWQWLAVAEDNNGADWTAVC